MAMPFRPGRDVVSLLHRDFGAHLLLGATPYKLLCQYMANADSPTHGREGNVHHGDAAARRFPMISHLGKMLSLVVGGVWAARRGGEEVFGLAVIGDGGSSTGEFHESLNLAAVRKSPVLFLVENNHYAFSTPTSAQYTAAQLSDRAAGYGDLRPDDRRHGRRGKSTPRCATRWTPCGRFRPGDSRVHDLAAARPCRLRQGAVCARGLAAKWRRGRPLAADPGKTAKVMRPFGVGDQGDRRRGRGGGPGGGETRDGS